MELKQRMVFGAAVNGPDGLAFIAQAPTEAERTGALVTYTLERCDYTLRPEDAARVRALVDGGRALEAIVAYFASVGKRWDAEWLELWEHDADAAFEWRKSGEFTGARA